jgi:hydroxyacylglutathione hydrolase
MHYILLSLLLLCLPCRANITDKIEQKSWLHGAADCSENNEPAIDILQLDPDTYILRENKCVHYEAPFIYLMFGHKAVFIQDTGATEDAHAFPLYATVRALVTEWQAQHNIKNLQLIVTHSHSHDDHYAGDQQFAGKPGVSLIAPNSSEVRRYFAFTDWPQGQAKLDLGGRELIIIPLPGHQKDALGVYDPQTQIFLSGDSFYPGRLYVRQWQDYKQSIQRLVEFNKSHLITAFLGTHIEMSKTPGIDYPTGSSYQPNEATLPLSVQDLIELDTHLQSLGDEPQRLVLDKVIVVPVTNEE